MGEIMTMIVAHLTIASIVSGFFSMVLMGPWVMIRMDLSDRVTIPIDLFMTISMATMAVVLLTM